MYQHFIEVHKGEACAFSINVANIELFDNQGIRTTGMATNSIIPVLESYEELKQLIWDAGCHIAKKDPRIDHTNPLTMEELKGMAGEIVWNSNSRGWMKCLGVRSYPEIQELAEFKIFDDDKIHQFSAADLSKFPLYRMRGAE